MKHNELTQGVTEHSVPKIKGKYKSISLHNLLLHHMLKNYNSSKHQ
jgi:hypothetical protein